MSETVETSKEETSKDRTQNDTFQITIMTRMARMHHLLEEIQSTLDGLIPDVEGFRAFKAWRAGQLLQPPAQTPDNR